MSDERTAPFPRLAPPSHAVLVAEAATGIVVHEDGRRWVRGDPSPWKEFPSFDAALRWAEERIERSPRFECNICDDEGKPVRRVWRPEAFAG